MSQPTRDLLFQLWAMDLKPETELRFHETRRWRFDIAFVQERLAVEVQGGGWKGGRHHRPKGYRNDCEKAAYAMMDGWRVLHVVPEQIQSGEAISWICELLRQPGRGIERAA